MFKKKLLSAALSAALMTAMLPTGVMASETTPEWNTNGGKATVEGGITTVNPVLQVELPGDLVFGINPLYLDANEDGTAETTQIASGQYAIINYSDIDVLITASTTAKAGEGVNDINLLSKLETATVDANSKELAGTSGKRDVFLAQMLPVGDKSCTIDATTGEIKLEITPIGELAVGKEASMAGLVLSGTPQTVNFKLAKYDFKTDKLTEANVSGFVFDGAVDPDEAYAEGDVIVTTVFKLGTLSANQSSKSYETMKYNTSSLYNDTVVTKKTVSP